MNGDSEISTAIKIALPLLGAAAAASVIYALYVRGLKADANEDGKVTKEEFDEYLDTQGIPILSFGAKIFGTIIGLFWKFDEVETTPEEENED